MVVATHSTLRAGRRPPDVRPPDAAPPLSLALLEGARECIDLARECVRRGVDPRRQLRWATARIRKLPAALAPPGDKEITASLADLAEYMCRELRSVHDATGLGTLERMYDLLREIRGAWVIE